MARSRTLLIACAALAAVGCQGSGGRDTSARRPTRDRAERREAGDRGPDGRLDQPAGRAGAAPPRLRNPNAVFSNVLHVDDEVIAVVDVLEPIRAELEAAARDRPAVAYYRHRDQLVRRQLVETVAEALTWQEARYLINEQMEPQLEKIVAAMEKDRIIREFDGRETLYERHLASIHRPREDVRKLLRRKVVVNQYLKDRVLPMAAEPTKRELKRFYDGHIADLTSEARREMFLIDIPVRAFVNRGAIVRAQVVDAALENARVAVDAAAAALAAGTPFEDVAREYSRGHQRTNGGSWGFISATRCELVDRYEPCWRRLCAMKSGQHSDIIEVPGTLPLETHFFIVKTGRIEGGEVTSFQDAQPAIRKRLMEERFRRLRAKFLQSCYERAHVGDLDAFYELLLASTPKPGSVGR